MSGIGSAKFEVVDVWHGLVAVKLRLVTFSL